MTNTLIGGGSMWLQQELTNLFPWSQPIMVSAWSVAQNVTGVPGADYSLYLDVGYSINGSIVNTTTFIACFTTGTHNWEYKEILVPANPPAVIERIFVNLVFRSFEFARTGTVYFDDVSAYYYTPACQIN